MELISVASEQLNVKVNENILFTTFKNLYLHRHVAT